MYPTLPRSREIAVKQTGSPVALGVYSPVDSVCHVCMGAQTVVPVMWLKICSLVNEGEWTHCDFLKCSFKSAWTNF